MGFEQTQHFVLKLGVPPHTRCLVWLITFSTKEESAAVGPSGFLPAEAYPPLSALPSPIIALRHWPVAPPSGSAPPISRNCCACAAGWSEWALGGRADLQRTMFHGAPVIHPLPRLPSYTRRRCAANCSGALGCRRPKGCCRWGSERCSQRPWSGSAQTTHSDNTPLGWAEIRHPFHPLRGQSLPHG
jgi:hypothetical protein